MTDLSKERELSDDYPLYPGYLYVIDGKVQRCVLHVTVGELKRRAQIKSVKNCDIGARNLWDMAV